MKRKFTKKVASYLVDFTLDDGVYSVSVPALPGCFTFGKTLKEAERHAKEAIVGFIEALQKQGKPIPVDHSRTRLHIRKKLHVNV